MELSQNLDDAFLSGIFEECKECCEVGNTETGSKVERVILEVCKHRLR